MPLPVEIIALGRPTITFVWEDEHETVVPARELRLRCKCAQCVDEWTRQPILDPATVPASVVASGIEIVGNYGMTVQWSDGHFLGIYTFRDLREACSCTECSSAKPSKA